MTTFRTQQVCQIEQEIDATKKAIERAKLSLRNLGGFNLPAETFAVQEEKLRSTINRLENENLSLEERKAGVIAGKYDDEMTKISRENRTATMERTAKKRQNLREEFEDMQAKLAVSSKKRDPDNKHLEKDYNYHYRYFQKVANSVPDYMTEKLESMPGNKGYIWRGMWLFGRARPEYGQPLVLFEKLKGNILRIHEIGRLDYKIFEKAGKAPKKLVSKKARPIR
jgi:hypothetical protein